MDLLWMLPLLVQPQTSLQQDPSHCVNVIQPLPVSLEIFMVTL